jgi:hypothetical protein
MIDLPRIGECPFHTNGERLLDGRQIAVLAHAIAADHEGACHAPAGTGTITPWEETVAACLNVLCLRLADRPTDAATSTMLDRYVALGPEHVVFRVRLGLTVLDSRPTTATSRGSLT